MELISAGYGPRRYDVFLAHGSGDKEQVVELYRALKAEGLLVFYDAESLEPGEIWRPVLEDALENTPCLALCIGPKGPGPWTELELDYALSRSLRDTGYQLILVLLPGGSLEKLAELSPFLPRYDWVALPQGPASHPAFPGLVRRIRTGSGSRPFEEERPLPVGHIQSEFSRLQGRFFQSIRPNLAGQHLIPREETERVTEFLKEPSTRIVVVHGSAGSGKSGVLYELAQSFSEQGVPFLPLRLDRLSPQGGSLRTYVSSQLELPGLPGQCLRVLSEEGEPAYLLLDQMDALRWTGAHSAEAWDICREMIDETLRAAEHLKVVLCCRTFDLEHDPQFDSWQKEARGLKKVRVGDLSDEQVKKAVERAAAEQGRARHLEEKELALLRHVHHLQMWLLLYPELGAPGSLTSRRALMERFWEDRRSKLTARPKPGLSEQRVREIESLLVEEMQEGAKLTASRSSLRLSQVETEAFQSLHVLQIDASKVSFSHQSYLDFLVAIKIVDDLSRTDKSILDWLGAKANQSLFRREQLRLVLEELRERDSDRYVRELTALIHSGNEVRFHLRLLGLQFLSQVEQPTQGEKALVLGLLEDDYWQPHVQQDVVWGKQAWFKVLDEAVMLERWLKDGNQREFALTLMRSVSQHCGDVVARLLKPYLEEGGDWLHRVAYVLPLKPSKDSEGLFELRLQLVEKGAHTQGLLRWDLLAKSHPGRLISFLEAMTASLVRAAEDNPDVLSRPVGQPSDWSMLARIAHSHHEERPPKVI